MLGSLTGVNLGHLVYFDAWLRIPFAAGLLTYRSDVTIE
jgi:hypothetical protein